MEIVEAGEVVTPVMSGYRMKCCGCGLIHKIDFKVIKQTSENEDGTCSGEWVGPEYRVQLQAWRED